VGKFIFHVNIQYHFKSLEARFERS
jgi:hypothetical protein